ncbi:hypothetical protein V5799_033247 [Amblyomma americanum]|uniref:Uncharacterized protein n=1 Tax=Amblyomma americanum TaxID=6943 RepID=A0AAQ4DNV6_AMBAM
MPFRCVISEKNSWQDTVSKYLQSNSGSLKIDDPYSIKNSEAVVKYLMNEDPGQRHFLSIDVEDMYYSMLHTMLMSYPLRAFGMEKHPSPSCAEAHPCCGGTPFETACRGAQEARCAYCVCLLVALLLTDALSPQVIALLPFVLFLDRSVDDHPLYFKIPMQILHELAMVLMVASVDATSLLCRTALYAVSLFGTRVRTLLCLCLTGAVLFTLLMNGTAAVLIMAAIADNMVQLLQNDLVQRERTRARLHRGQL